MSKLITFETAKLAYKMGFNEYCPTKYNPDGEFVLHDNPTNISAPSQDDLQSWLESKGMFISIAPEMYATGINWNWQVLWYLPKERWEYNEYVEEDGSKVSHARNIVTGTGYYGDNGEFPTRHEAMEAALAMGLMKINVYYRHNSIGELAKLYKTDANTMLDRVRQFSNELGDWRFRDLTMEQLDVIVSKMGEAPVE